MSSSCSLRDLIAGTVLLPPMQIMALLACLVVAMETGYQLLPFLLPLSSALSFHWSTYLFIYFFVSHLKDLRQHVPVSSAGSDPPGNELVVCGGAFLMEWSVNTDTGGRPVMLCVMVSEAARLGRGGEGQPLVLLLWGVGDEGDPWHLVQKVPMHQADWRLHSVLLALWWWRWEWGVLTANACTSGWVLGL